MNTMNTNINLMIAAFIPRDFPSSRERNSLCAWDKWWPSRDKEYKSRYNRSMSFSAMGLMRKLVNIRGKSLGYYEYRRGDSYVFVLDRGLNLASNEKVILMTVIKNQQ